MHNTAGVGTVLSYLSASSISPRQNLTFPLLNFHTDGLIKLISLNLFVSRRGIGGNAHENWTLLRLQSFIIGVKIPFNDPVWQVIMN